MCLSHSNLFPIRKWNWEGDFIVQKPTIPASRKVPGTNITFDTDIREFLLAKDNAVIKREIEKLLKRMRQKKASFFLSRRAGSFDFRVRKILEYVAEEIKYEPYREKESDDWLFPDETISRNMGDCEDRSFLLASMIIASGVSGYVVRVALGKLYDHRNKTSNDHVWVMYKNESGRWILLETQIFSGENQGYSPRNSATDNSDSEEYIEYVPYFLFNHDHLWRIAPNTLDVNFKDYIRERKFWKQFDPKFAAGIHNSIFDEAFSSLSWVKRLWMKSVSLALDTILTYDPRDHFDNSYIPEGWDLVSKRLKQKTLTGLAHAAHTIADFYAHSTYACFAKTENNSLVLYDPAKDVGSHFESPPDYGTPPFDIRKFSKNESLFLGNDDERIQILNREKIISGRFAQEGEKNKDLLEKIFVEIPYKMRKEEGFSWRGALPHHDEIAVDKPLNKKMEIPKNHKLYTRPEEFDLQFQLRKEAAVRHIREVVAREKCQEWL